MIQIKNGGLPQMITKQIIDFKKVISNIWEIFDVYSGCGWNKSRYLLNEKMGKIA